MKSEVSIRSITLLRPYLFWLLVISVGFMFVQVLRGTLDYKLVAALLLGGSYLTQPFSAFWFVTALAFAAVLYRAIALRRWVLSLAIGAGLTVSYANPAILAGVPLGLGVAIPALLFVAAGHEAKKLQVEAKIVPSVWVALLLTSVSLFLFDIARPLDIKSGDFGTPVLSVLFSTITCMSLTALALVMGRYVSSPRLNWISQLARESLVIVLVHAAVLWVIGPFEMPSVVEFFAALLVPIVVAIWLRRTPKVWELATGVVLKDSSRSAESLGVASRADGH